MKGPNARAIFPSASRTASPDRLRRAMASEASSAVYTKLNQKLPTPAPGAGERVFYESLLAEKPCV